MADTVLGSVFAELLKVVTHVISKSVKFKSELEKLKWTLESITPLIREIETLNIALNIPVKETAKLKEELIKGTDVVRKCSEVKCSCFKRVNYSDKLIKLNQTIERICRVDMLTQLIRDNKKILAEEIMQTELIKDNKKMLEQVEERGVNMQTDNKKILVRVNATRNEKGGENRGEIDELCSVPEPPDIAPGLDASLEELRKELVKDNGMQVIVVTAPGGYGKTTLVKKLCTDDQVKELLSASFSHGILTDKFKENIFFVTVSKTPDVKFIIQRILQHMKKEVPTFQTEEAAINDLERFLKSIRQKAILLVLDDVWLESLVQKFKFKLPNYKILVTSRSVFPQFGSGHQLKPLNDEAAMILFRSSVTPQDGKLTYFDENLANKILRVCKGSPLALTVVGKFLCGEPAAVWQSKVKEWDRGESIFIAGTELLVCLQSSLNALDDKVKECYLDLSSFPQDQWIPLTTLIDMWMELHEWVEDGLSAINYLHELSKRNLVNLVIARKHASDDHFCMHHDILRDLIVHQSKLEPIEQRKRLIIDISGNQFPKWWSEQNQNSIHARLLSISTGWYELNAPEVEVIVLNVRTNKYALPNFMCNMGKLKVVIVSNMYGFLPAELSNFSLLGSDIVSNLRRIRLEHVSIPSFDVQMKNLQKISLFMCNVGQAFRNSNCQISDSFPNLLEFEIDYCNDLLELPDALCEIVSLKKLNITECFKLSTLPEEIGKLVKLEELRLASCTLLKELPEMVTELSKLKLLDISGCLSITKLPTQIGKLCSLEMFGMRGCSSFELPQSIENLERLKLVK
ncbi:hypothetical protein EZV62_014067 [Acer yangbiense]|uniref:RPW8 domain-containing protein n=1 Tax=Acer yangbiense TaxID=1000413 RepID=A0A5C7HRH3_9ROSI|nr:hypothetical protein EZV62_014067 [Acer yangbiense]